MEIIKKLMLVSHMLMVQLLLDSKKWVSSQDHKLLEIQSTTIMKRLVFRLT